MVFFVCIAPEARVGETLNQDLPFPQRYGVKYVRGAEVIEIADESGNVLREMEVEQGKRREGNSRTMRVYLDTAQYQADAASGQTVSFTLFCVCQL